MPEFYHKREGNMEMNAYLTGNLEVLQRTNAPILQWLTSKNPDVTDIGSCLMINRRGLVDWRLPSGNGIFDGIAPHVVYRDWIPADRADTSVTIIVGCNLGYGLNHVLGNTPDSHKVLVVEPRSEMILACLGHTDYRLFFDNHKLSFIPPDPRFLPVLARQLSLQYFFGNIFLRSDIPSRQLGPEYAIWFDRWTKALEDMSCNMTTMRDRQDVMVRNELENYARAMKDGSLLGLRNQGAGISAVVLGAGPSLAKFAGRLADNPGSSLCACGFQTLPALQRFGLKPHFCMAVDPARALKRVYDRLDLEWIEEIPLVYACAVDPEVLRMYPGPTISLWTLGGLGSKMPREREFVLDAGGNVGVALTRFLVWCGVDKIILVGQDFAWHGRKTHVSGHISEKNEFKFDSEKHIVWKNRDGQTIYSSLSYASPMRALEKDIQQWRTPIFNLYGGGAVIEGAKEVTWRQILDKGLAASRPGRVEHFSRRLVGMRRPRTRPVFESRSEQWAGSLDAVQKHLAKLSEKAEKNQLEIHGALRRILVFFRQDPLYQPYLFKEILGMAGLVHAKTGYAGAEIAECQNILRTAVKKVKEIDYYLMNNSAAA